jgi:hypothetical protein
MYEMNLGNGVYTMGKTDRYRDYRRDGRDIKALYINSEPVSRQR